MYLYKILEKCSICLSGTVFFSVANFIVRVRVCRISLWPIPLVAVVTTVPAASAEHVWPADWILWVNRSTRVVSVYLLWCGSLQEVFYLYSWVRVGVHSSVSAEGAGRSLELDWLGGSRLLWMLWWNSGYFAARSSKCARNPRATSTVPMLEPERI